MAGQGAINLQFFTSCTYKIKRLIIDNVAAVYGVTDEEAFTSLFSDKSKYIGDYLLKSHYRVREIVAKDFKSFVHKNRKGAKK